MADNRSGFSNRGNGLDRNKKNLIMIVALAVVIIAAVIVAVIGISKIVKNKQGSGTQTTPTSAPTAAVTLTAAPTTPPTAAPTQAVTVTSTPTPTPTQGVTATPTAAPTTAPAVTPAVTSTPTPDLENNRISADEAYRILCGYSKEALSIAKEVTEYEVAYDSSTTLINGLNCYRFDLSETVDGKFRNRGEFYISDDGRSCFVVDGETGNFVPLPQG